MDIDDALPSDRAGVDPFELHIRVIYEYADEFAGCIARTSDDSYFYHGKGDGGGFKVKDG